MKNKLDYSLLEDIQLDGIDHSDAPDYVDAFIVSASYNGRELTKQELDELNEDSSFVYECVIDYLT